MSSSTSTGKGLSSRIVIGLTVVAIFAAALAVFVTLVFVKRRRRAEIERNLQFVGTVTSTVSSSVDLEKLKSKSVFDYPYNSSKLVSPYGSVKSILGTTPIVISSPLAVSGDLSTPNTSPTSLKSFHPNGLPPSPHKPQVHVVNIPPKKLSSLPKPSIRKVSSQEIVGRHEANGTMPRPFAPLPDPQAQSDPFGSSDASGASPESKHHNKTTARISRSSLISNRRRSTLYLSASASDGELHADPSQSNLSVVSQTSSVQPPIVHPQPQPNVLKVRSIFTPFLPDELVLRPNEKLTLIKSCSDGWCIVGRKSPFYVPSSPVRKEFGQRDHNNMTNAGEVEIGAVPAYVFESGRNVPGERPEREESLRVVITMGDDDGDQKDRKDVVSWSNVY